MAAEAEAAREARAKVYQNDNTRIVVSKQHYFTLFPQIQKFLVLTLQLQFYRLLQLKVSKKLVELCAKHPKSLPIRRPHYNSDTYRLYILHYTHYISIVGIGQ